MPDLKLLLLEDNPEDEKLLLRTFHKAGYNLHYQRIQTAAELENALHRADWDIIISDYSMPAFDGIHALRILTKSGLDIPFIIVSGHIGEATAVAAMREGADDYVMKDNLSRLVPATERAIKEAKDRRKRIRAERSLEEMRLRMEGIIASAMDAIVTTDQGQKIIMMNKAAEDLFLYKAGEVEGQPLDILLPMRYREKHREHLRNFGHSGKTSRMMGINRTVYGQRANGEEFPVEASISQVQIKDQTYFTVILRDVTHRVQAEEQEKKLNAELIHQNEQLQQFGYITSHNMRGPVATIMGLVNLLKEEYSTLDADIRLLAHLDKTVQKLDQVITDMNVILDKKAQINLIREDVFLDDVIDNIRSGLAPYIKQANAILQTDFSVIDRLFSVRVYIHSILYNLISNAIKFRDPKRHLVIRISAALVEQQQQTWVCLECTDNGIGFNLTANRDRIFGLYKRFHHHVEGKGLGLHLVKTQAEALGGKVEVTSTTGEGSSFSIFLPLQEIGSSGQ